MKISGVRLSSASTSILNPEKWFCDGILFGTRPTGEALTSGNFTVRERPTGPNGSGPYLCYRKVVDPDAISSNDFHNVGYVRINGRRDGCIVGGATFGFHYSRESGLDKTHWAYIIHNGDRCFVVTRCGTWGGYHYDRTTWELAEYSYDVKARRLSGRTYVDYGYDSTPLRDVTNCNPKYASKVMADLMPKLSAQSFIVLGYSETLDLATTEEYLDTVMNAASYNYYGMPQSLGNLYYDWMWYTSFGWITGDASRGLSTAYSEACKQLPEIAMGFLGNVTSALSTLKSLLNPKGKRLMSCDYKSLLCNAWLSYRYSYTTTKLDIEEYKSVLTRLVELSRDGKAVNCYGSFKRDGIVYNISFKVNVSQLLPDSLSTFADKMGMHFTLQDLWDIVPYSFIVDWFSPIADFLENLDARNRSYQLTPYDVWGSLSHPDGWYMRIPAGSSIKFIPYMLYTDDTSKKTVCMRIADVIALFC